MASQQVAGNKKKSRHRIREIALDPPKCAYAIDIEILVDGKKTHKLQRIEKGKTLCWDNLCLPCDVQDTSTVTIQVTEIHTVRDKAESHAYTASQVVEEDRLLINRGSGKFMVNLRLISGDEVEQAYRDALAKVQRIESRPGVTERLGRVAGVFKGLLEVGGALAELDPTGGAKVAFALCSKAWEHLEAQDKLESDLRQFIESLASIIPSIEDVKRRAEAHLSETVRRLVELIEDVSVFVLGFRSQGTLARFVTSTLDTTTQEQIQIFISQFQELKEEFRIRLGVQVLGTVQAIETEALMTAVRSKLQPANLASYDPSRVCMTGTRVRIIRDVASWVLGSDSARRFAWINGLAGLGKSSVATSLCALIDEKNSLGASFFCKRDNPELRAPGRVLTTIAYSLAIRWKAYGDAVMEVLVADPEAHTRHIQPQYEALLAKPLRELAKTDQPADQLLVVVDALDECGDEGGRKQLLACLRDMSRIAAWLRVVVTSRPDADIQEYFGRGQPDWYTPYNLLDYDAGVDIRTFIAEELSIVARVEGWSEEVMDQLSDRSCGLFIWARTACKYIGNGHNPRKRLERVLNRTYSDDASSQLDSLYATAVKAGSLDDDEDNLADVLEFLGVVAATAACTPLSVPDISRLVRGRISEYSLNHMVGSLTSVLYRDPQQGYAVCACHPSFIDYITDKQRSKELCIDLEAQNAMLAKCCVQTMIDELCFDICDLGTSDVLNKEVPGLDEQARARIETHLRYSCTYWTSHIVRAGRKKRDAPLQIFLYGRTMMYWIEAMSLLSLLHVAVSSLLELRNAPNTTEECRAYARDVYRFILSFYDAICACTPHLYISALPLAPSNSLLAQRMRPHFPNTFKIIQGAEKDWTPCIRTIWVGSDVNSVAWSADGRLIATGSDDETVRVWDAETGAPLLAPMCGHSHHVMSVNFSPDSRRIVSGSSDETVRIWNVETGAAALDPLHGHSDGVLSVVYSYDGSLIASGSGDNTARIWDAVTGDSLFTLSGHSSDVYSVAFSRDNHYLASGSSDESICIWDVQTGEALLQPLKGHTDVINSVAFSFDGARLVSGSDDSSIRLWDTATGASLREIKGHSGVVWCVRFSHDNQHVLSSSDDGTVRRWDAQTGAAVSGPLLGHTAPVCSTAYSPDGRRIVSGSWDKTVRIWDAEARDTGSEIPQGHSDWVQCVTFSPDGRRIASCSEDRTIRVWDAETGASVLEPIRGHSGFVHSVAYSPDGQRLVSGSRDNTLRIWHAETGAALLEPLQGHQDKVNSVVFSPNGKYIASGSDDMTVRLCYAVTGASLCDPLEGHSGSIYSVAFSPNGRHLASGSADQTVRLWDVHTGASVLEPLHGHSGWVRSVAFSPNGNRLASGSDDETARIWDATTGLLLLELSHGQDAGVISVSFSPNSLHILSCSSDGTIQIWDAETGTLQYEPLKGHSALMFKFSTFSACFLPDGHHIVSGSSEGTIRTWDLRTCAKADSQSRRLLPRTHTPLLSESGDSETVTTSSLLARQVDSDGWVRTSDGGLYVWLPLDLRGVDDSSFCISSTPPRARVVMDFAKFVHGREWQSVAKP